MTKKTNKTNKTKTNKTNKTKRRIMFDVPSFCERNNISSAWFYKLHARAGGAAAIAAYAEEPEHSFDYFTAAMTAAGAILKRGRPSKEAKK